MLDSTGLCVVVDADADGRVGVDRPPVVTHPLPSPSQLLRGFST
jgi:hypothetical protein